VIAPAVMAALWTPIFEPGFFATDAVRVALTIGAVVSVVSGPAGVFTVMRGQSFAGESLGDVGTTGGSAAFLLGISPLFGFVGMGVVAAATMEIIGARRARGRDLATGIVLGAGLGLAALFLYLDTTEHTTSGATIDVLFGSIFAISSSTVPTVICFSVVTLALLAVIYRPLLLSSVSPEVAEARAIPVRLVGFCFLLALAVAVSLAALTIGAILSTALLIGPSAAALRVSRRPGVAMLVACLIGVSATWLGVLLAYDSYDWLTTGLPVSFFVVTLIFMFYLAAGPLRRLLDHRRVAADRRR
jgi:zinc/manganese transport system permease protein